ncbi:MAG: hypothetical protein ACRYGP_33170 [Janthinobacterium lividum]
MRRFADKLRIVAHEQRRKADADRETDERLDQIESDQARILRLLRRMDAVGDAAPDDAL